MKINKVQLLPVEQLRPNPDNPKKPLGARYKRGLKASLERFGFAGVLAVGANADGTWTVLDGTSRLEDLDAAAVQKVPCVSVPGCTEGEEGWQESRKEFTLAYDRNRKLFDEDAVLRQLKELSDRGRDVKALEDLTATEGLARLLSESAAASSSRTASTSKSSQGKQAAQGSLVLYGPAEDIAAVKELLKRIKGRLSPVAKVRSVLEQAEQHMDFTDENFAVLLLSAFQRWQEAQGES